MRYRRRANVGREKNYHPMTFFSFRPVRDDEDYGNAMSQEEIDNIKLDWDPEAPCSICAKPLGREYSPVRVLRDGVRYWQHYKCIPR